MKHDVGDFIKRGGGKMGYETRLSRESMNNGITVFTIIIKMWLFIEPLKFYGFTTTT